MWKMVWLPHKILYTRQLALGLLLKHYHNGPCFYILTSDVSEPYDTLKKTILESVNLTYRRRFDQLRHSIELQHVSGTKMLLPMWVVTGRQTLDDNKFG